MDRQPTPGIAERSFGAAWRAAVRDNAYLTDLVAVAFAAVLVALTAASPLGGLDRWSFAAFLAVPLFALLWLTGRLADPLRRALARALLPFLSAGLMYATIVAQRPDLAGPAAGLLMLLLGGYAVLVDSVLLSLSVLNLLLARHTRGRATEDAVGGKPTDDGAQP